MRQDHAGLVDGYGVLQRRASAATLRRMGQLWQQLDTADLSGSWTAGLGTAMVRALSAGQLLAASSGQAYVDAMVAADGLASDYMDGATQVNASALSGVASDGRALDSLLYLPIIRTKTLLGGGMTLSEAMLSGWASMQRMVLSEVADAGNGSSGLAMAANRTVTGYVRCIRAGACARCAILAGRWYRYDAGFQRHKRCFPAGVVVSGPQTLAATRRWYEGELVILTTASGQELPATGNHPVLTRRGWVAANLIQEGDEVVRSLRPEGAAPLVVPDHQQMPSRIEDVWNAESVAGVLRGVPTTAKDFHGDGGHGEVDVVGPNRLLWREGYGSLLQDAGEADFTLGPAGVPRVLLAPLGRELEAIAGWRDAARGSMGRIRYASSFLGGHSGHAQGLGLALGAEMHPCLLEVATHHSAHDAMPLGDGLLSLSAFVSGSDLGQGQRYGASPRWDAIGSQGSVEDAATDARVGMDLLDRLTGQVELDRVVQVRRIGWSGHVYDLNSTEGWFSANGLIVSNCQCYGVPATDQRRGRLTSASSFFNSLSASEQDRRFTVAGAQAIRDGADLNQVVNSRRGISTIGSTVDEFGFTHRGSTEFTDVYGRRVQVTSEGSTRRGSYYQQARADAEARLGYRFARGAADLEQGLPRFQLRAPRLTPSEIYKLTGDRDELIRLLKRFGYLL